MGKLASRVWGLSVLFLLESCSCAVWVESWPCLVLCVSDGCISGVLGIRFSGALSVLVGGSGFCETRKTQCRNDRVGSYSCHHVDGCY